MLITLFENHQTCKTVLNLSPRDWIFRLANRELRQTLQIAKNMIIQFKIVKIDCTKSHAYHLDTIQKIY